MSSLARAMAPDTSSDAMRVQGKCACGAKARSGSPRRQYAAEKAQRTLAIGGRNDPLEAEADRVAATVADDRQASPGPSEPAPVTLRRSAHGSPQPGTRRTAPAIASRVLERSGTPIEPGTRRFLEGRMGGDFSAVRIHADGEAGAAARSVSARAYTVGDHIVFGERQYAPVTKAGRRLLAHELTHVLQQSTALRRTPEPGAVNEPDDDNNPIDDYESGADNEIAPVDEVAEAETEDEAVGDEETPADRSPAVEAPDPLQKKDDPAPKEHWILVKLPSTLIRFEGSTQISRWGVSGGKQGHPTPTGEKN